MNRTSIILVMMLSIGAIGWAQQDWPMSRYDPAGSSYIQTEYPFTPPFQKEIIELPEPWKSRDSITVKHIIYKDQVLYIVIESNFLSVTPNSLIALDVRTGAVLWACDKPKRYQNHDGFTAPAVSGDLIICGEFGEGAKLKAYDRYTGEQVWARDFEASTDRIVTDGNRCYLMTNGYMRFFNVSTSSMYWEDGGNGPIVIYEDKVYEGPRIRDKSSGSINRYLAETGNVLSADANGILLYRTTDYFNYMEEVETKTYDTVWSHNFGYDSEDWLLPTVALSQLYVIYSYPWFYYSYIASIDRSTGAELWRYDLGEVQDHRDYARIIHTPTIINNTVYAVTATTSEQRPKLWTWVNNPFIGIDCETGRLVFYDSSEFYCTQAIYGDGNMFVGVEAPDTSGASIAIFTSEAANGIEAPVATAPTFNVHPHPITSSATVTFTLQTPANVSLTIHDALGRQISKKDIGNPGPGMQSLQINTNEMPLWLPSGIYTFVLQTGEERVVKPVAIVR
jgi:putative pyrroloquinoline-quinone binding quinoprotein